MPDAATILSFDNVTIESRGAYDSGLWQTNLSLAAGDLALVLLDREHEITPLADGAGGLIKPDRGTIRFLGEDWQSMSIDDAAKHRGTIGRVFARAGWVSNLDIAANIVLARMHHDGVDPRQIVDEAAEFAKQWDLSGLPRGPVFAARSQDLTRAACVRAFLGEPKLIILERPTRGAFPEIMPALINAVRAARSRGAAVMWTTTNIEIWRSRVLRPTARYRMFGSRLRAFSEAADAARD
ncbi:MAG: hypothetical protein GC162_11535 [Planctomycetes bacterium]|nr:hypothetical protein [Planctomycetota bacterium]